MKKTGKFKPYTPKGLCALTFTGIGVYIIYKGATPIYVGFSSYDVKKTMYRHFQKWTDKRHPDNRRGYLYDRVTYSDRTKIYCQVYICSTPKQAAALEQILILKLKPRDNTSKIDLFSQSYKREIIDKVKQAKDVDIF